MIHRANGRTTVPHSSARSMSAAGTIFMIEGEGKLDPLERTGLRPNHLPLD
jgi:hypothetical protein